MAEECRRAPTCTLIRSASCAGVVGDRPDIADTLCASPLPDRVRPRSACTLRLSTVDSGDTSHTVLRTAARTDEHRRALTCAHVPMGVHRFTAHTASTRAEDGRGPTPDEHRGVVASHAGRSRRPTRVGAGRASPPTCSAPRLCLTAHDQVPPTAHRYTPQLPWRPRLYARALTHTPATYDVRCPYHMRHTHTARHGRTALAGVDPHDAQVDAQHPRTFTHLTSVSPGDPRCTRTRPVPRLRLRPESRHSSRHRFACAPP